MVLSVLVPSVNQECAKHNRYPAHLFCKHPNQARPPGEDWTQDIELIPCEDAARAERHARRPEEVYCRYPPWKANIDPSLSPFCAQCEHGSHGDTTSSATFMMTDFDTKKDQWEYRGRLSQEETLLIQENIRVLRGQYEAETQRGPWNNSYWVLSENLDRYTAYWEDYVNTKLEAERQQAQQRQEDEMYRDARLDSRIADAMETVIYNPGQLAQLEASRVDLPGDVYEDFPMEEASGSQSHSGGQPGSSSQSHHHGRQHGSSSQSSGKHKHDRLVQFFGGKKRRK